MDKEKLKVKLINHIIVNLDTYCWEWKRVHPDKPYGSLMINGKRYRANRLSAYVYLDYNIHGTSKLICHKCNNPSCINPEHLYIGTDSSNTLDSVKAGTHTQIRKTHCPKGHELVSIRSGKRRICKTCQKIAEKKCYDKTKKENQVNA